MLGVRPSPASSIWNLSFLAVGVGLFFGGTAASIYLWTTRDGETRRSLPLAAGAPYLGGTLSRPPDAARAPAHSPGTRPGAKPVPPLRPVRRPAAVRRLANTIHPMRPIAASVRYEARSFPVAVRITLRDSGWAGAQWTARTTRGLPACGWIALAQLPTDSPRGMISMETAFAPTPSVGTILARLRSARREATYGRTRRISLAGFVGWEMDGRVAGGSQHVIEPFSPRGTRGTPPDAHVLGGGERFRVVVLDVRGTRVVLVLQSVKLPPKEYRAFLARASRVLDESLEFPG